MKFILPLLFVSILASVTMGQVVITEIMYNPASSESNTNTQYIEIVNTTNSPVDIGDWTIDDEDGDGPNVIPAGTIIPADGILILVDPDVSDANFTDAWSTATADQVIQLDSDFFNMSNSPSATSEIVELRDDMGILIDEVNYDDSGSWPSDSNGPSITLTSDAASVRSSGVTLNDDGSEWAESGSGGTDGSVSSTGLGGIWTSTSDQGSPGTYMGESILPVELLSFDVRIEQESVKLSWATATEINNDYFIVQARSETGNWEELTMIQGAGNSSEKVEYAYTDTRKVSGVQFYRLMQVDYDGASSYSPVQRITLRAEETEWPTLITHSLQTDIQGAYHVYNAQGQHIINDTSMDGLIDLTGLTAGSYVLRTEDGRTHRFVKQ